MEYILKFINGEYEDENALYDVNKYIYQPYKTKGLNGGYNVLPEYAVDMMQDVKDLYHMTMVRCLYISLFQYQ